MTQYVNGYVDREDVVLLRRDEYGELVEDIVPAQHVGYFKRTDISDLALRTIIADKRVDTVDPDGDYYRVAWTPGRYDKSAINPRTGQPGVWISHREEHCRHLEKYGLVALEADVNPLRRHISDNDIHIARPRRVYLDIETDSRVSFKDAKAGRARVLVITAAAGTFRKRLVLDEDSDDAETAMLRDFWHALEPYDQIVAWNGGSSKGDDGFDFPVLRARSAYMGINVDTRRWLWMDQMLCFKRNNIMSAESGEEKSSFKLEAIAQSLLGEGKHDLDASKAWDYWAAGGESRTKLADYCMQDTLLLERIEAHTGYLELFQTLCEVCRVFPETGSLKPTRQVDGFMLRLGVERGVHFPTKWYSDEAPADSKFKGAFVMEPTARGIVKDVHVADFASLYPSIMITWNLSPDTKLGKTNTPGCIWSPETGLATSGQSPGILSAALQSLLDLRAKWTAKRASLPPGTPESKDAERRTNAYKTAANSFYGVCGNKYSRFFDRDIAEATTQNGAWLIKLTIAAAEERGWSAIYGDTDSVFVTGCNASEFSQFVTWCNTDLYPAKLAELGCRTNKIKLAYEKQFARLTFTAAKRYVGIYAHYKGKAAVAGSKPEIKGLEIKRGDVNRLTRELQSNVVDLFASGCESLHNYSDLVDAFKRRVITEPLDLGDVVLSKALSKSLKEYSARTKEDGTPFAQPAHVRLAKEMALDGEEVSVGTRIAYVVMDATTSPSTVIPADEYTGISDRYWLWENMVWPPTERLLTAMFPSVDWTQWSNARPTRKYNPDQISLFGPIVSTVSS